MIVKRKKLLEVLRMVKPGLATKEVVEQSVCFAFQNGRVYTYNDEISISHPTEVVASGAVQAEELFSTLSKSKDEELDISATASEFQIKGKRMKAGIRLEAEIKLPLTEIDLPKKKDWKELPGDFVEGVKFCLFSCGTDMTKPVLMCIFLTGGVAQSSDDLRVTEYAFADDGEFDQPILLPIGAAREITKYKPTSYAVTFGWAHFKTDEDTIFSCRTMDETYPDMSKVLQVEGERITLPKELIDVIERAKIFSKATDFAYDERVTIRVASKFIQVRGEGDTGWLEEKVKSKSELSSTLEFDVSPDFLAQIMVRLQDVIVGDDLLKFEGENFTHVMTKAAERQED